jgi:hypothetical protein
MRKGTEVVVYVAGTDPPTTNTRQGYTGRG